MGVHVMTGFGFGPIQAGLFAAEAFRSGRFGRVVIAEVDASLVDAVRAQGGRYAVNVAHADGVTAEEFGPVEMYNPRVQADRIRLLESLAVSTEIVTSLPSVDFYGMGEPSVAGLISEGLARPGAAATLVYTAENNNHAAEIMDSRVRNVASRPSSRPVQYLNTVIGKMSQVIADPDQIAALDLRPICEGINRAFLVEEFNRILVGRCDLEGVRPGIGVFDEKPDLLPFEEAKLYGHNAIHATLAYLAAWRGYTHMSQLRTDERIMTIGRRAFIEESGAALRRKYARLGDPLFTEAGWRAYAEDLLERMTNPHLQDAVARAARDPRRKLAPEDRLFGTMRLALREGVEPLNLARGALAALEWLLREEDRQQIPDAFADVDPWNCGPDEMQAMVRWLHDDTVLPEESGVLRMLISAQQGLII